MGKIALNKQSCEKSGTPAMGGEIFRQTSGFKIVQM